MNKKNIKIVLAGCAALLLSSCYVEPGVWGGAVSYSTPGFSTSVAWSNASYDVNGFPIYGYSYGRPVYGYTASGAAIYSIAALTTWCYVPSWRPAPWYCGHYHYPSHCHRAPAPPKYAHGHKPHHRPAGGVNAPIHKNPSAVLGRPTGHHANHSPGRPNHNAGARPNHGRPSGNIGTWPNAGRPNTNAGARPNNGRPSGNIGSRPNVSRPNTNAGARPNHGRPSGNIGSRPNVGRPNHNAGARPNVSRPSGNIGSRPNVSRPSHNMSPRPSVSRPSGGGGGRPSGMSRPSGGPRGGGHRR